MEFAFLFPGQGSQAVGMLNAFADNALVRQTIAEASEVLSQDLWKLIADGPVEALGQTINTQPVMLAAGVATYRVWQSMNAVQPAYLAGHSLGEYTALVAADALTFADALRLVRLRAEFMQSAVPATDGAMAAILGLDDDVLLRVCADASAQSPAGCNVVAPVNFNAIGQTVIAGHRKAVNSACDLAKAAGAKRALLLPVSVPSHCELMQPAAEQLAAELALIDVKPPLIPVIQNADVAIYTDASEIKSALVRQLYRPVRWVETVRRIVDAGVLHMAECGPGKVLTGLGKRIHPDVLGVALVDLVAIATFSTAVSVSSH
jgi:[acyl-carrier-protein] S-malonyltransferase